VALERDNPRQTDLSAKFSILYSYDQMAM